MIFKVGIYRRGKADLIKNIKQHGIQSLSLYCATVTFPVAAALVFCIEEWPEKKEELERRLAGVKEFYGYDSIEE